MSALAVVALVVLGGCALAVLLGAGPWLLVACLAALFLAKPGPALAVVAVVVGAYLLTRR